MLPLAGLARRIGGPAAGAVTAWVAASAPACPRAWSTAVPAPRPSTSLLISSAVWCVVSAADARGRGRALRSAGAGLLVGLAYLTRPEGLFFALPHRAGGVLFLALRGHRRAPPSPAGRAGPWPLAACFAVPLVLCIAPYAAYLHENTGKVQLSAKTQDASIEAWHAVAQADRQERDSVLWALDDTGLHFANTERTSLPALARSDPGGYAAIVGTNVVEFGQELLVPEPNQILSWVLLPAPLWILVAIGAWRARRSWAARLVLAAGALPVATALAFFVQPRYLVVTSAFATVFVGCRGRLGVAPVARSAGRGDARALPAVVGRQLPQRGRRLVAPVRRARPARGGPVAGGQRRPRRPHHDPQHGRRVLRRPAGHGHPLRRDGRDHRLRAVLRRPLHRRRLVHGGSPPPAARADARRGVQPPRAAPGLEGARRGADDAAYSRSSRRPPTGGRWARRWASSGTAEGSVRDGDGRRSRRS